MTTEIKIGTSVTSPITDSDGEQTFVIGKLVSINSRYAKIELSDGSIVNVGKTKIEALEVKTSEPKIKKRVVDAQTQSNLIAVPNEENCPKCDIHLSNGVTDNVELLHTLQSEQADIETIKDHCDSTTNQFECMACGHQWGPDVKLKIVKNRKIDHSKYDYVDCVAASGRPSKDNNDIVAQRLRGKTLDEAYLIASDHLGEEESSLRSKYSHLNQGQQRMCLGNRIRGKK